MKPRNTRWRVLVLVLLAMTGGCRHLRPPKHPQPTDPFPDCITDEMEYHPSIEVEDRLQALDTRISSLTEQLHSVQSTLRARERDLMATRVNHEDALEQLEEMKNEISYWGTSMKQLHKRLSDQEERRLEMLDDLSQRISEIRRSPR